MTHFLDPCSLRSTSIGTEVFGTKHETKMHPFSGPHFSSFNSVGTEFFSTNHKNKMHPFSGPLFNLVNLHWHKERDQDAVHALPTKKAACEQKVTITQPCCEVRAPTVRQVENGQSTLCNNYCTSIRERTEQYVHRV